MWYAVWATILKTYFSTSLLVYLPYMVYKHAENCKFYPCLQVRSRKTSCAVIPHLTTLLDTHTQLSSCPLRACTSLEACFFTVCVHPAAFRISTGYITSHTPQLTQLCHVCFHCHWHLNQHWWDLYACVCVCVCQTVIAAGITITHVWCAFCRIKCKKKTTTTWTYYLFQLHCCFMVVVVKL